MWKAYYNENDPKKAAWLKELINRSLIAPGDVNERSVVDVQPGDLRGYAQCHFFAGIGIWSYALRLAGWPDEREVWTGSCPCQPFSAAGKGEAFNDERHLWPEFFRLIKARRPHVVFGEQVSSIDGLTWFDLVRGDLDNTDYTYGVLDTFAGGVGAPHRRKRLYWVAHTAEARRTGEGQHDGGSSLLSPRSKQRGNDGGMANSSGNRWGKVRRDDSRHERIIISPDGANGKLADMQGNRCGEECQDGRGISPRDGEEGRSSGSGTGSIPDSLGNSGSTGLEERRSKSGDPGQECAATERTGSAGELAEPNSERCNGKPVHLLAGESRQPLSETSGRGPVNGFWRSADWVLTRPQRVGDRPGLRPVERGTFPLAHGTSQRVGRLRGYGEIEAEK